MKCITHLCMRTSQARNLWLWPGRPPSAFSVARVSGPGRPGPGCPWPKCPSTIPSLMTTLLSADNSLNPDQACQRIGPDLDPNCLTLL